MDMIFTIGERTYARAVVDGAGPVLHSAPMELPARTGVVLFLAGLGSTKEKLAASKRTQIFEEHGYACVLADHFNEGERRESSSELSNRAGWALSQKQHFWPAIHRTAATVPRLVDFALLTFGTAGRALPIYAYGSSMGGDIFLASIVSERRLRAIVCERSTPDWLRPGSTANVLGESAAGDELYQLHAPCNRLSSYVEHPTRILFILGESDTHVPPACAEGFIGGLRERGVPADRLASVVLRSAGWEGHILRDAEEATNQALQWFAGAHEDDEPPPSPAAVAAPAGELDPESPPELDKSHRAPGEIPGRSGGDPQSPPELDKSHRAPARPSAPLEPLDGLMGCCRS